MRLFVSILVLFFAVLAISPATGDGSSRTQVGAHYGTRPAFNYGFHPKFNIHPNHSYHPNYHFNCNFRPNYRIHPSEFRFGSERVDFRLRPEPDYRFDFEKEHRR